MTPSGATLRGTPTGTRADISVTSFALSHIITAAGTGGMVCVDDPDLADRALLLRRWGRRSEVQIYGSAKGVDKRFFSEIDGDLEYDNLFIFDEVGWNFEPSELSAAFGEVQLAKLPINLAARKRNFARLSEGFGQWPRRVRAAPPARRPRHGLAHVPPAHPTRVRHPAQRLPGPHGGPRRGHPHGLDGQRPAPARLPGHRPPSARRPASPTPTGSWSGGWSCPATTAWTTTTSTTSCPPPPLS